jgi:small-conductance mechanosensitive channel
MNTDAVTGGLKAFFSDIDLVGLVQKFTVMIFSVLFILAAFNLLRFFLGKLLKGKISEPRRYMVKKGIEYTGFVLAILFVFKSLGIDTTAILGAAGIAGIIIGFAAQTSVSSLISGFFLLSEKPFTVGDIIKMDSIIGVVLSVDLLSVKLRTFDNLFVRIPNETIIKNNLVNITRFPIRRLDLTFSVGHREDLERVQKILLQLAAENQYCLENPEPFFGLDTMHDSGTAVLFHLWFEKSNFWNLKNSIILDIHKRFQAEGIEIPGKKIHIAPGLNQEGA